MRTRPYATAIVVFDEVELLDVAAPLSALSAAGRPYNFRPFKVELVANKVGPVSTRGPLLLNATRAFAEQPAAECLIVPGGYGARRAADDPELLAFLQRRAEQAEFIMAVGNGVFLLAKAGLVDGERIAASAELGSELVALCPSAQINYRDPLVISGKIASTQKSALSLDLSCEMVARLFGSKLASNLSAALGIAWEGELSAPEILSP